MEKRQEKWAWILRALHEQATEIPISGKAIPAVYNERLNGYVPGQQQYDYPAHTLRVVSGSKNITVSPGAQTGLFTSIGRGDPHSYRPNEFFFSNWVYDGLVEYGPDGEILPALATSWSVEAVGEGEEYTFDLRQGVTFSDGATWNCAVAKLNFEHMMAPPLRTSDWHGWYGFPAALADTGAFSCESDYVFKIKTKMTYYPLLQDLTYIRPTRMLSPNAFNAGASSDVYTDNSCPTGWSPIPGVNGGSDITCKGTKGIIGTGRWTYVKTVTETVNGETKTKEVILKRNKNHWDTSTGDVEFITLVVYDTAAAVNAALLDKSLDAVLGAGVLEPSATKAFKTTAGFTVKMTKPIMNRMVIFNTAKAPTNNLQNRKAMIHAIDKETIIDKELAGLANTVDALFPKDAPYCGIDLTPKWSYDIEKAELLNCPVESNGGVAAGVVVAIVVPVGLLLIGSVAFVIFMRSREIQGKPLYKPLVKEDKGKNGKMHMEL